MKNSKRIGCFLSILFLCFCGCSQNTDIYLEKYEESTSEMADATAKDLEQSTEISSEVVQKLCYVYICGEVVKPGVYAVPEGSRVYEVIELAEGLTDEADDTFINQAEPVTDGMMIRIYSKEEVETISKNQTSNVYVGETDTRVDINTAGVSELMTLPGIGMAKAEAILAYRIENDGFSSIEDLMNVPGIKEATFQQMKEHIKVN